MILKRLLLASFIGLLAISCRRKYACWCEATVTVDSVTTLHKYEEPIISTSLKKGQKICDTMARDTHYSKIECKVYDD